MNSTERPAEIKKLFSDFYHYIDEEDVANAEKTLDILKERIGNDDSEIAGCNVKIKLLKYRSSK